MFTRLSNITLLGAALKALCVRFRGQLVVLFIINCDLLGCTIHPQIICTVGTWCFIVIIIYCLIYPLLAYCEGNPQVTHKGSVMRGFDVFDVGLYKLLNTHSVCRWFETCPCDVTPMPDRAWRICVNISHKALWVDNISPTTQIHGHILWNTIKSN